METLEIKNKKKNIIDWIYSIENQEILNLIEKEYSNSVSEEDFEKKTSDFIKSLSWEK
jgi:uncharacterized tellurite resistance protein B-like protein